MPIPREVIDEVRARTSLAEIIGKYVTLTRSGASLKGLCPFHGEKTASFNVHEARNIWHCFGCSEGGDVFKFLMKIENRSFVEVVEDLAAQVGVDVPKAPLTREQEQARSESEEMFHVNEKALAFFRSSLAGPAASSAREYFRDRGLSGEILDEYRLGWCGPGWDALKRHLQQQRTSLESAEKSGLLVRRRQGEGWYDRFHERITFPVTNHRGRVIGFGGRAMKGAPTLGAESPKYLNSSESPVYHKSDALYGLDTARAAIGKHDRVIVVEGYFDVLGLAQAGIREAVATCGTALTPGHLAILRRYTNKVILLYDGDEAGQKAAVRSLPIFLEAGVTALYCGVPSGHDPDTWVARDGVEAVQAVLARADSVAEFYIRRLFEKHHRDSASERTEVLKRVAPIFEKIADPVLRDDYAARLSDALNLPAESVVAAIARRAAAGGPGNPGSGAAPRGDGVAPSAPARPEFRKRSEGFGGNRPFEGGGRKFFGRRPEVPSGPPTADLPVAAKVAVASRDDRNSEETVLRLMLGSARVAATVRRDRLHVLFRDAEMRSLGETLAEAVSRVSGADPDADPDAGTDGAAESDQPDIAAVLDALPELPERERRVITRLSVAPIAAEPGVAWKEFQDVVRKFRARDLADRKKRLRMEIAAAEKSNDSERLSLLLNESRDIDRLNEQQKQESAAKPTAS